MISLREFSWGVFALLATASFAWADPVAQVTKLSGSATLLRENATAPLVLGAALEPGDEVATDATGRVRLQLIDGSVINLGSETRFAIDQVISGGIGTDRNVSLDLSQGALLAGAAKATPNSRFEIRTPRAVTSVRGTEWGILSDAVKTDVMVVSGRVGVRKNEISGASGVSLTRQSGISVTNDALGESSRWGEDRFAELMSVTSVPGAETGFDLNKAAPLSFTPTKAEIPATPAPQSTPTKRKCYAQDDDSCDRDRGNDSDHEHNDHDNDHEHDSIN